MSRIEDWEDYNTAVARAEIKRLQAENERLRELLRDVHNVMGTRLTPSLLFRITKEVGDE